MNDGFARHTPTLSGKLVVRALAIDDALLLHLGEVISDLALPTHWIEVGESVPDIVDAAWLAIDTWYSPLMIGSISAFLGQLPDFWLPLDGSTHDQEDYPELFVQLDSSFKNPGAGTFTLPDFADSFIAGALGAYGIGDTGGEDSHVLTVSEMPAHNHLYTMPVASPDTVGAGAPIPSVMSVTPATATSNSGSDAAHENRPNYIAVAFGIFSGRE